MKGKTCGLCGMADGEVRQEYRTPNGRVSRNAVSFAHSWTIPAESCKDTTGRSLSNHFQIKKTNFHVMSLNFDVAEHVARSKHLEDVFASIRN